MVVEWFAADQDRGHPIFDDRLDSQCCFGLLRDALAPTDETIIGFNSGQGDVGHNVFIVWFWVPNWIGCNFLDLHKNLRHNRPTININGGNGKVRGLIRRKENNYPRHFARICQALEWNASDRLGK